MAIPKPFTPVKLICGIMASREHTCLNAEKKLVQLYGPPDTRSPLFSFDITHYYENQMGKNLKRMFLSFQRLISPESLSAVKLRTNRLEKEMQEEGEAAHRIVNLDPGYLTAASLIMATAKDFSHRIPLLDGIYAHLEFLFGREEVRVLDWTYPDFREKGYQDYFLGVRRIYLSQLKKSSVK